jgi:hypothetical protein
MNEYGYDLDEEWNKFTEGDYITNVIGRNNYIQKRLKEIEKEMLNDYAPLLANGYKQDNNYFIKKINNLTFTVLVYDKGHNKFQLRYDYYNLVLKIFFNGDGEYSEDITTEGELNLNDVPGSEARLINQFNEEIKKLIIPQKAEYESN